MVDLRPRKIISWDDAYEEVMGTQRVVDTIELRTSFIENVLYDINGDRVVQGELQNVIQGTIFKWQKQGIRDGILSAPYGSGKSQQVTRGLSLYLATLDPSKPHIMITAEPELGRSMIDSIRQLIESNSYKYWCQKNHIKPAKYDKRDTGSAERIVLESLNTTGVPTFFSAGIQTKGTGWRTYYLWGDDICNNEDFKFRKIREKKYKDWVNTWTKRTLDGGFEYLIRTPYHPQDANERLLKTGQYAHLEIAIKEDKSGYRVREWIPKDNKLTLVSDYDIPLWEVNHSIEKLEKEEAKDYSAYQLGYRMLKEVQDPAKASYKMFSERIYPAGNVYPVEFDWMSKNPLEMTMDFNRGNMCWAFCQKQNLMGMEVYAFIDELSSEDVLTEEQAIKAAKKIQDMGHTYIELYGDGTGNQGGARYGRSGENDWNTVTRIFREYGIQFRKKVKISNPLREERVKVVNNALYSVIKGQEVRRVVINPKCTTIIDDYKYSVIDDRGSKKKDQGSRGHMSDACDYRIYWDESKRSSAFLIK